MKALVLSSLAVGAILWALESSNAEVAIAAEEKAFCKDVNWRYGRIIKSYRELAQPNHRGDVAYVELGVGSCQQDSAYRLIIKEREFSCATSAIKGNGTSRSCVVPLRIGDNSLRLTVSEDAGAQYVATYSIRVRPGASSSPQRYVLEPAIGWFSPLKQ